MKHGQQKEHLYDLDQVKKGIGLRAYGQKDPKIEYQRESFAMFENMMRRIREATIDYLFKVQIAPQPARRIAPPSQAKAPADKTLSLGNTARKQVAVEDVKPLDKLGRNDPCPCGSGKKYKKCCGNGA